MPKLLKQIVKDDTSKMRRYANNMFRELSFRVGRITDEMKKDMLGAVATQFLYMGDQKLSYMDLSRNHHMDILQTRLKHIAHAYSLKIEMAWKEYRTNFDILSRVFIAIVARKASPPWKKVVVNLKDEVPSSKDFTAADADRIHMYINNLVDQMMGQLRQSAVNRETYAKLIKRARRVFVITNKRPATEANRRMDQWFSDEDSEGKWQAEIDYPDSFTVETGQYSKEDYMGFIEDMRASNNWSYRATGGTRAEGRQNAYLRDLEQLLMYDTVQQLNDGMLQIGSDEMGIEDFEWVVSGPNICDDCIVRSGLTTSEISKQVKDDYGDDPPPLHPHCNCQLVPQIKSDWAKGEVEKAGFSWEPETGIVYSADENERQAGWTDMTFEDYIKRIGK